MSKGVSQVLRPMLRAVAVYAAGAWVAIEIVDFAVRQYGLSKLLVDSAVVVAFSGGMLTAVLVWFHGEPGRQKVSMSEVLVVGGVVVATAAALFQVSSYSPTKAFEDLPGYRLELEFRYSPRDESEEFQIAMSPIEGIQAIEGGILGLSPEEGRIHGPIIDAQFEGIPTLFVDLPDSDLAKVVFVLPYEPSDITELVDRGAMHDAAEIDTSGLSIEIESSFTIAPQENGATIRLTSSARKSDSN